MQDLGLRRMSHMNHSQPTICLRTPKDPKRMQTTNPCIALIRKNMFIVWGLLSNY